MNNSATSTLPKNVIRLVKYQRWYLPHDLDTFRVLQQLGVPVVKINEKFLPTLIMLTKKHGYVGKVTAWSKILDPFLDKIGAMWLSRDNRKCR